jgi:hypothetical protein
LETPIAYKNNIEKISTNPDIPVPEPNVITKSEGRAFKYPIKVASPKA